MSTRTQPFESAALHERLLTFPAVKRYLVGFSGGADSTALLYALVQQRENLGGNIEACHFNHGLNPDADAWEQHCRTFCEKYDISLHCHSMGLSPEQPNLENTARELRYQWVSDQIDRKTVYLTAHHADDRAETFLLNALRGSGLDGVSSIPSMRELGPGHVIRPLLDFPRASLVDYLERHGLKWIEDPSNQDSGPDRNFIRNEVIPLLESRWPATGRSLARTSAHLATANALLKQLLEHSGDLSTCKHRIPLSTLGAQGQNSHGLVLRQWLHPHQVPESRLSEFLEQVSKSDSESKCELTWKDCSVRLFRDELYLSEPGDFQPCPEFLWDQSKQLELGDELGTVKITGEAPEPGSEWSMGSRRSGVHIRTDANGPSRKLKKIMQEQLIPPWQRMSIPILYRGDEILAIGDWLLSFEFAQWLDKKKLKYQWQPNRIELRDTQDRCHALDPRRTLG